MIKFVQFLGIGVCMVGIFNTLLTIWVHALRASSMSEAVIDQSIWLVTSNYNMMVGIALMVAGFFLVALPKLLRD